MPTPSNLILQFLSWTLNVLVSRGGDGNLLHELDLFKSETREGRNKAFILPFLIISVASINVVRYTLGHTLPSILTLQSLHIRTHGRKQEYKKDSADSFDYPLSRHLASSLRVLYEYQGMRIFFKGLHIAAIYQLARSTITSLLTVTVLQPAALQPLAILVATVALAEWHMCWTHATISTELSGTKARMWCHDRKRWRRLLLPSAAQGGAVVFLNHVSRSSSSISASDGDISRTLSAGAVRRVFVALAVRVFVVAPTSAWLTIVEVSCSNLEQETLVYEREKERFVRVKAVFAGYERHALTIGKLWKTVSLHLCLWLLELHVKKCAVQMLLEGLIYPIVPLIA